MRKLWLENKFPLLLFFAITFIGLMAIILYDKPTLHLLINNHHHPLADTFFAIITHIGSGTISVILAVIIALFISVRKGWFILFTFLTSGLVVQVMKRFIFSEARRPIAFFGENVLHTIEGVQLHHYHAFPSGHTTSAMALGLCFCIIVKHNALKHLFLLFAFLVAFSRVYISQHFMEDIVAGTIIAFTVVLASYPWIYNLKANWLDTPAIKLIGKK